MARNTPSSRTIFPLTVLALLALGLGPTRYTGWVASLRNPLEVLLRPVSDPLSGLSTWLRPGDRTTHEALADAELERQRDEANWLYARALDRITELESLIRDLQGGVSPARAGLAKGIEGLRVASDVNAGTLEIGRGRNDGVREGSVVMARKSEQLIGPVVAIGANTCTVRLLTDKRIKPDNIECRVMPDGPVALEQFKTLPRFLFKPAGDGMLIDASADKSEAARIQPGQLVRLADESWSPAARMLVVGRVVKVEASDKPLFARVVVRPEVDVSRVRSVIVQIPTDAVAPAPGAPRSPGGRTP